MLVFPFGIQRDAWNPAGIAAGNHKERGKKHMKRIRTLLSSDGKHQLHVQEWCPEEEKVRAVVQLTHGMVEYIDRYDDFARFLSGQGFLVVGHDQLGHGHTAVNEAELGYIEEHDPCGCLVRDMHLLREDVQKAWPGVPYFMLGHSMGSYLLRRYLCEYGKGLAGAVIMGTGFVPPAVAELAQTIARTIALSRGWTYRSALMQKLSIGSGAYRQYNLDGTIPENSWLTRDVEIVKKYYADPFCGYCFTLNGYRALFSAVAYDADPSRMKEIPADLPLLLVSGDRDPVGDMGKGVRTVYEMMRKAGLQVEMKLFEGDRHEILNELDRSDVYAYLGAWFVKNLA